MIDAPDTEPDTARDGDPEGNGHAEAVAGTAHVAGEEAGPVAGGDGAGHATGHEAELKFRLRRGDSGLRYVESDTFAGLTAAGPAAVVRHEDRYLDTATGAIQRAGYAARVRRSGSDELVTVKSAEQVRDGFVDREELEGPAGDITKPAGWPASAARDRLVELSAGEPLVEVVTLRQERHKREYGEGPTRVEVSVDEVDVVAEGVAAGHFAELEVELLEGDAAALPTIRLALADDAALRPAKRSKVESALAVVRRQERGTEGAAAPAVRAGKPRRSRVGRSGDGTQPHHEPSGGSAAPGPQVPVTGNPGVEATDPLAEAGRKVLRFHFARLLVREAAVRDPESHDIEDLHAMRVAVRRMRAAWRFFGDAFRPARTKRLRDRLREVGDRLGGVRDLDVLLDGVARYIATDQPGDAVGLVPLIKAWHTERTEAERQLLAELDSPGYTRWRDAYRDFVTTAGAAAITGTPTAPGRVRDTAGSRLWALYEQVGGYEQVIQSADVPTLHRLRIDGKRLRYALEFLRETLGPEGPVLIKQVTALQDHVGALHDADVAAARARALLVESSVRLTPGERSAVARYLESRERELSRLRRTAQRPYGAIASPTFRRRLARIVAEL